MKKTRNKEGVIWSEDKLISKDKCYECNKHGDIHFHHIIPYSKGGRKTIPLCEECHGKVHGRDFLKHSQLIRDAVNKRKQQGVVLGRKKGSIVSDEKFLLRYPDLVECYKKRISLRSARSITKKSINTIRKVYKLCNNIIKDDLQLDIFPAENSLRS